MKEKIAITIRSFGSDPSITDLLKRHCTLAYQNTSGTRMGEDDLIRELPGVSGVIAGTERFSSRVISAAENLRVISRVGVGTDSIDREAAAKRGITIYTTSAATVQPVAEHTTALILSIMKRIPEYQKTLREGDQSIRQGSLLSGKCVGIVGLGKIGSRVGELLSCMGCRICYYDPFSTTNPHPAWTRMKTLGDLLAKAEIITLHAPAQKDNAPIMNEEAFNQCRHGVLVINTARGSLVDETALYKALKTGRVAGAGLDVASREPYDGPLLGFPQVIVTPHVATNTVESRREMEMEAVNNLIKGLGDATP